MSDAPHKCSHALHDGSQKTSLKTILEHPRARRLFISHLQKLRGGFARSFEQRLYFCEAVSQYLQLEPAGFSAAARSVAQGIVEEFVPDGAPNKVSFSLDLTAKICQCIYSGNSDPYPVLLRQARQEAFLLLEEKVRMRVTCHVGCTRLPPPAACTHMHVRPW